MFVLKSDLVREDFRVNENIPILVYLMLNRTFKIFN